MNHWLVIGGVIAAALLLRVVVGRWFERRHKRRMTRDRLAEFKSAAVSLNEHLDRLQLRHQQLPIVDPDFKEPMVGLTREEYDSVSGCLSAFRSEWLEMMDAWDEVQTKLDEQESWSVDDDNAARKRLEAFDAGALRRRIDVNCGAILDRLATAHEDAESDLDDLADDLERLDAQLGEIEAKGLPRVSYDGARSEIDRQREQAVRTLVADPLGTRVTLEGISEDVNELGRRTEQVLHHVAGIEELRAEIVGLRNTVAERRSSGLRYCEPGAAPEPLLNEAEHHAESAWQSLVHDDAAAAEGHLASGFAQLTKADELITLQDAIREEVDLRLAEHEQRLRELRLRVDAASATEEELTAGFAVPLWSRVRSHRASAAKLLDELAPKFEEIRAAAGFDQQRYLAATRELEELARAEVEIETLLDELHAHRDELQALRTRVLGAVEQMSRTGDGLQRLLNDSTEDRAAANRKYHQARQRLIEVEEASRLAAPNWERLESRLEAVADDLREAERLAREDLRLARHSRQRLSQADRAIREAKSFYRAGVTADVSEAVGVLEVARRQHASNEFEAAMETADQAIEAARAAREQAVGEMHRQEEVIEEERQARISQQISDIKVAPILKTAAVIAGEVIKSQVGGRSRSRKWQGRKRQSDWE